MNSVSGFFDAMLIGVSLDLSARPMAVQCCTGGTYMCPAEQPTMGVRVFRRVHGWLYDHRDHEPALT